MGLDTRICNEIGPFILSAAFVFLRRTRGSNIHRPEKLTPMARSNFMGKRGSSVSIIKAAKIEPEYKEAGA